MNGHFSRLPEDAEATRLGESVLQALEASAGTVAYDRSTSPFKPVLNALELKNYGTFMKGTRSVDVSIDDDDVLKVAPMRNMGAREGFHFMQDEVRVVEDRTTAAVGQAVKEAVARSC